MSLIVFLLEQQDLSSTMQAAVVDQAQNVRQTLAVASSEVDSASAFIVQADPAILLFDDFLARLSLSSARQAPWGLARVIDRSAAPQVERQLRIELGNPKFGVDVSRDSAVLAPIVMANGDWSLLQPGADAAAVFPDIAAKLDRLEQAGAVTRETVLVAGHRRINHQDDVAFFIVRFLAHDAEAPGRMRVPNVLIRGVRSQVLRQSGGLRPGQFLQVATGDKGEGDVLSSDAPEGQPLGWSSVQMADVAGQEVTIRIAGYPDWRWPRFWLLAFLAGSLATMLYGTVRSGQLIRAEARSLDRALSTAERELAETQRREVAFFENAGTANCETEFGSGKLRRVNDAMCRMFGYSRDELVGRTFLDITHPDDRNLSVVSLVDEGGKPNPAVQFEKRYCRKDGSVMWGLVNGKLHMSESGEPLSYLTVIVDITARKRDEDVKAMLLRELAHRVRNTVQLTASLSRQSARQSRSVAKYEAKFHERLTALSAAQDLLFDTGWKTAPIQGIAERTIKPFQPDVAEGGEVVIDLPPVDLPTQQAQTLAIALHELVSNSAQYGALAYGGNIALTGKLLPVADGGTPRLYLCWQETMQRRVRRPRKSGFGMTMLQSALPDQFQGESKLTWQTNGMRYEAWLNLPPVG